MKTGSIKKIFLLILVTMVFILLAQDRSAGNGEQRQSVGEAMQEARLPGYGRISLIAFLDQDIMSLAIDPMNPSILYASVNIGPDYKYETFKSEDGGASWKSIQKGLPVKCGYSLYIDPHRSSNVFAVQMNGIDIYKSSDSGENWKKIFTDKDNVMFTDRIVFDPATPGVLYVGSHSGILQSRDSGENWICVYQDPYYIHNPKNHDVRIDFSLYSNPFNGCVIYADYMYVQDKRYCFGGSMRTTDCGASWQDWKGFPPVFHPFNLNVIYSIGNGWGGSHGVWKSVDGGEHWSQIGGPIWKLCFNALAINPNFPEHVFVNHCWDGIYVTLDGGLTWSYCGLKNLGLRDITFAGKTSKLYVSTLYGLYAICQLPNEFFPKIDIVQPKNQQVVCGVVPVQIKATDDLSVTRVDLFVDNKKLGERNCSGKSVSFSFDWDTRPFALGNHDIFVKAIDDEGRDGGCRIHVNVRNVVLNLQCQKVLDRAWSAKKRYAVLTTEVQNPGQAVVAKYILSRREGQGVFQEIKLFTDADLVDGKLTWKESITKVTPTYEYKIEAFDAADTLIGQSNPVTVTGD